jgi:hypothetical protein
MLSGQALLPIFLKSMRTVSRRLPQRLVVMATNSRALQACKSKHAHCLPWYQRV